MYKSSRLCALFLSSLATLSTTQAMEPYRLLKDIPVGSDGGWDYLSVDASARRLYVSHATKVVVIDLDKDAVVGEIADTPGVHGLAVVPELKRGFSSNGRENKVSVVDLETLKTLTKVDTGENPDAIIYEPGRQEVYAFNGRGQSATVISAKDNSVVATIPLGGKPEFAAADVKAGRVYCNIEDKSTVVAINTATHAVVATWPIAPAMEASGLAIDIAHHRLFLGCNNKLMVMLETESGKVFGSVPIGEGVDANNFDPGTGLAFASCSDGTVTIAQADDTGKFSVVQTLATERGSRTMTLDPQTHHIWLAAAKYEAPAAPAAGGPAGRPVRPKMLPGSFHVLEYGNDKP